ncbi:MAG TPA: glycosyltransferase family 1 protein, partial [bacterium]|nr:glycosyltransferase family 1 protein [bacterium]
PTVPKKTSDDRLKIGIDARLAYRRGVGTYVANLIRALLVVDPRNQYFLFNAPDFFKDQFGSSRVQWIDLASPNAAFYEQWSLPRAARRLGLDFLHYIDNSASVLSSFPYLLTLHDVMFARPLSAVRPHPTLRQNLVHWYKRMVIPPSVMKARRILTVSEHSKEQIFARLGVSPHRIHVTPEGVDRAFFAPRRRPAPGKEWKVLIHGAADERKNVYRVFQAAWRWMKRGRRFQLSILGMDEAELRCTDYVEQAELLGISPHLRWLGRVPREQLAGIYAQADLFLYPSLLEGFGLPLLEAFACGVPVVTSNTTALPEVAGNAALLVDPESPEAIAQGVERVMTRPALRRQLVARGMRRAREFNWARTARLTLEAYEQLGDELGRNA